MERYLANQLSHFTFVTMKTHLPQSIPQAREIIPVPCSGTCTCTCVHPYGIEAHNYIVDVVGGWLIERYLNLDQGLQLNSIWSTLTKQQ